MNELKRRGREGEENGDGDESQEQERYEFNLRDFDVETPTLAERTTCLIKHSVPLRRFRL